MNYLIIGDDSYTRQVALEALIESLVPQISPDVNVDVYDSEIDSIENVVSCSQTVSLFSSKRIVVLKRVDKLKQQDLEKLSKYLENPFLKSTLILLCEQVKKTKIWQTITKQVKLKRVERPKGFALDVWIKKEFEHNGKAITKEALKLFNKFTSGQDLQYLKTEIEKVTVYLDARGEVVNEDIRSIVGQTYEEDVFSLVKDISRSDSASALARLERLFIKKVKPHELIGLLGWHFRKLLLSSHSKTVSSLRIHKSLNLLLETDLKLKTTAIDPVVSLETTILTLCAR
jgi:DNA polymerase-3 subunit delta